MGFCAAANKGGLSISRGSKSWWLTLRLSRKSALGDCLVVSMGIAVCIGFGLRGASFCFKRHPTIDLICIRIFMGASTSELGPLSPYMLRYQLKCMYLNELGESSDGNVHPFEEATVFALSRLHRRSLTRADTKLTMAATILGRRAFPARRAFVGF